jgi:bacterioferritin
MDPFVSDIRKIRERARSAMTDGAVTGGYRGNVEEVVRVLNEVLATELVCALRYKRHYFMADGIHSEAVKEEFKQHAAEEEGHADQVANRIRQLNGAPNFNPEGLQSRSHAEYGEGTDLVSMIELDLVAERIAVQTYTEIARWLGDDDPTTRRMIEQILEKEEEHADDLANLIARLPKK